MIDYTLTSYDDIRMWIKRARENSIPWEEIMYGRAKSEEGLKKFLKDKQDNDFWPKEVEHNEWKEFVKKEKENEDEQIKIIESSEQAMINDKGQENGLTVPQSPNSTWQLYKKHLGEKGFKKDALIEMENTTIQILKNLNRDTTKSEPIKGMVIGNVQSGKTANMGALMTMAADWGWNMFIILSGTIESLRKQTHDRMVEDIIKLNGNFTWLGFEHLAKNSPSGQRSQDLKFNEDSKQRYFTVCLKNKKRLNDLIQWLQADKNQQKLMKILVIDDEADQAGVNTADINKKEAKAINTAIKNLVNGKNSNSNEIIEKYKAMNYIGYTATPYANVLNESSLESLYPRNFITTLGVSKEYFGPQQIFGIHNAEVNFEGLDIVRIINKIELDEVKDIHDGFCKNIPKSLQDAICWFMCGVATMRVWGYKKPISMLIHTSQKTDHHEYIAKSVKLWLESIDREQLIDKCKTIWEKETKRFTLDKFRESYKNYSIRNEDINSYPNFEDIVEDIYILLENKLTNIMLNEDSELEYHKGIHMCIDNCKNNGTNEEGMHVRLAYPKKETGFATAFIVIGGATLSRGLTIEGLISTFFLRSVSQADTLMQMGRWFGYRKSYELIPRIWMTEKTQRQFEFLAELDQELRDEIHEMAALGRTPEKYGPKVKNSPKLSFIRITAKNKMQSAQITDVDFSGSYNQTYLFDNDKEILDHNLKCTSEFIINLGKCKNAYNNPYKKLWMNIKFSVIKEFLLDYKFNSRLKAFNNIKELIKWIEKTTDSGKLSNWNIILSGNKETKHGVWSCGELSINKVSRTKKIAKSESDSIINIGVLIEPNDILLDIDYDSQSSEVKNKIDNHSKKHVREIRNQAGLLETPQLIIYIISKDSKAKKDSIIREDLGAKSDIVGLYINIPCGSNDKNYTEKLHIPIKDDLFDEKGDVEGTNED